MVDATVLIVDDDRTIVRLCQRLLERSSYQVITAIDPIEGLKVLEQQKVDLLLSDIRMPIMDGFEMITRAKQYQPDLPVLVMTGYGSID
ncbi:MAG TPA: response regulator, partial [Anaerolineales bacterium]